MTTSPAAYGIIYALIASDAPKEFRYIGKTTQKEAQRLRCHLGCYDSDPNRYKKRWIKKTLARGASVELVTLDHGPREELDVLEISAIVQARTLGHPLTNQSDGGDGGQNPSKETREKIAAALRGKKRPPHIGEASRARGKLYIGEKNPNYGKTHSEESRRKISETHKGRILTDEHKAKMSEGLKGKNSGASNGSVKLTEDNVREIFKLKSVGTRYVAIAGRFGVHVQTIYKIVNGKKWGHLGLHLPISPANV